MFIYVSHRFNDDIENVKRAKKITRALALKDKENTYLCPLLCLRHLKRHEIGYDTEIEQRLDLLTVCEKIIIASPISESMKRELSFAKLVDMEVEYLEDT